MNESTLTRLREGNIPSPDNKIKQVAIWVGVVLAGSVAIGGYTYYLIKQKQESQALPANSEFRDVGSGDFFSGAVLKTRTEPRFISDFPTSQPVIQREKPLTASDAFNAQTADEIEKAQLIEQQNNALETARRNAVRYRQANAVSGFSTSNIAVMETRALEASTEQPPQEVKTHDKDFSSQGIKKDVSTLPVDLTRTITADRYISCILADQIHSQIAGQVTCQIENNVFGFHGRKILIPAGSRAIGFYQPLEKTGMSRFALQWKRIIRPDGVHIALTEAYASDQIGQAGVTGVVDNRFFDKYGAAIITASLSTAAQISMNTRVDQNSNSQAVYENFGTDLGKVTAAMLEDVVNIKPFAVVPSGWRLFIRPQTDIWLQSTQDNQLVFGVANKPGESK